MGERLDRRSLAKLEFAAPLAGQNDRADQRPIHLRLRLGGRPWRLQDHCPPLAAHVERQPDQRSILAFLGIGARRKSSSQDVSVQAIDAEHKALQRGHATVHWGLIWEPSRGEARSEMIGDKALQHASRDAVQAPGCPRPISFGRER